MCTGTREAIGAIDGAEVGAELLSVPSERAASDLRSLAANEPLCQSIAWEFRLECSYQWLGGLFDASIAVLEALSLHRIRYPLLADDCHPSPHLPTANARCRSGLTSARDPDKDENPSECGQQRVAEAVFLVTTPERNRHHEQT